MPNLGMVGETMPDSCDRDVGCADDMLPYDDDLVLGSILLAARAAFLDRSSLTACSSKPPLSYDPGWTPPPSGYSGLSPP
jgi:hypothetical protein